MAILPKSYCQAFTATRQPTDEQTEAERLRDRGQRTEIEVGKTGNIESNSIDVDSARGNEVKTKQEDHAPLFDNSFMQLFFIYSAGTQSPWLGFSSFLILFVFYFFAKFC